MKTAFAEEKATCIKLAEFIKTAPRLSMGDYCKKFENGFASYQQRKYCILFNSGGSANFALLQSLKNLDKIKEGDNIGFSSLTWSTNVMPLIQQGFNPVPIDCKIETLNVMSDTLEIAIQKYKLKAFFATNVLGFAGDLDKIKEVCERHNVLFIEDNCEALGSELNEIKTGNFSLASTSSFFVAHHMSTIEGGTVCTDDEELATMLTMVRANGWDRNLSPSIQTALRDKYHVGSELQSKYTFYDLAFNFRPTEITGFLGVEQLKFIEKAFTSRCNNYKRVGSAIKKNIDLHSVTTSHLSFISNFSIPIVAKTLELREKYIERFKDKVEIRPLIAGDITKQPFWKKYIKEEYALPGTDFLHTHSFYFGNYPELTEEDLTIIEELLHG